MFGSILELAVTLTITSTILISSLLLHDYVERSRLYSFIVEIDDIKKRVNLFNIHIISYLAISLLHQNYGNKNVLIWQCRVMSIVMAMEIFI